jgi:hypothetical protein
MDLIDPPTRQRAEAGVGRINPEALWALQFAAQCVESLQYLADLDRQLFPDGLARDILGYQSKSVDLAHGRWAAGTAITALDVCAVVLGRLHCGITGEKAFDLDVRSATRRKELKRLPGPIGWLNAVGDDAAYTQVLQIRHALTHKTHPRVTFVDNPRVGTNASRSLFHLKDIQTPGLNQGAMARFTVQQDGLMPIRLLITEACDLAARHVASFFRLADEGHITSSAQSGG